MRRRMAWPPRGGFGGLCRRVLRSIDIRAGLADYLSRPHEAPADPRAERLGTYLRARQNRGNHGDPVL